MISPPAPSARTDVRGAFLELIQAAELLTTGQFARAKAAIPNDVATAADAARALVAAGSLTKFQAARLLAGRTDGFNLGPYLIQEQVGSGTMGRVYKAKHRTMNRLVAIKVLSAGCTGTADARDAVQREVRAAAQLNHANILNAYDANELAGRFYLILEYVDGPNFLTLVRERGPLPIEEACGLIRQVALGLAHARERGMVHGKIDLKNLLLSRSAEVHGGHTVKIADFGIAKLSPSAASTATSSVGKLECVAPERRGNGRPADHRSDLYSLGAVFYFLLAGERSASCLESGRLDLASGANAIECLRSDVPPSLAILIHRLLSNDPEGRPDSAMEVVEMLDAAFGEFYGSVNFELPAATMGQYSFASGQFSSGLTGRMDRPPLEHSGRHARPDSGTYSLAETISESSPWEEIASDGIPPSGLYPNSALRSPPKRSKFRLSKWSAGLLLAGVAVIGLAVKAVIR